MTTVIRVARVLGCVVVLALAGPRPAAALSCGQRIGPGEQVVLDEPLGCDDDVGAALIVTGPAELDLNGLSIACTDADGNGAAARVGVLLLGAGAKVRNGAVYGCDDALVAAGSGRHRIDNVAALLGGGDGIVLASDRNRVRDGIAMSRGGAGFVVGGRANLIADSEASRNRDGFDVLGSATLLRNFANANASGGFLIDGTRSVLVGNHAIGSAVGFAVSGGRDRLLRNRASSNAVGILLDERSAATLLLGNVASGNTATDLRDEAPGCGTNRWRRNSFATRNQDCVQ